MYRHTQRAPLILLATLAAALALWGFLPRQALQPVFWFVLAAAVAVGVAFSSLTIDVTQERLAFWFGFGVVRRSFALTDIASCTPVKNPWWYGWGIHLTPRGWLYNVAGRDAVELTLRDGRTLRLGTDEPQELVAVIRTLQGAR